MNKEELIIKLTENYTKFLSIDEIRKNNLYWGGNGVGDRFANKKFNYCVLYSNSSIKYYSEKEDDKIPNEFLNIKKTTKSGIIGIFVFSKRIQNENRPIKKKIQKEITKQSCVICGKTKTICDHKNDLYNDPRVIKLETQTMDDFQPLCNHCNLQKRQICKDEKNEQKIYSAKNIEGYKKYLFEFPWEKKVWNKNDINCKVDTYWYDPVEFQNKIYCYITYTIPIINEIKRKVKLIS